MTNPLDDSKMDDLHDSKTTTELLQMADAEIARQGTRKEQISTSNPDLLHLSSSNPDVVLKPPAQSRDGGPAEAPELERGETVGTTIGELTNAEGLNQSHKGTKDSPSEFSSELSEHSDILQDAAHPPIKVPEPPIEAPDTPGSLRTKSASSRDVGSQRSERSAFSQRSQSTNSFGGMFSPGNISKKVPYTRAGMLGLLDLNKNDNKSDDETSLDPAAIKSPQPATYQRGRRGSLQAYKVPGPNKPKAGGGFVTIKRRHHPMRRVSGAVPAPRRFSSTELAPYPVPGQAQSHDGSSSIDFVPPPPTLDMTQSMAIAMEQLKAEKDKEKREKKAAQIEPKCWLYATAMFTLVFSTMGLLSIVLYAFGAAYGNVYQDTRDQLEYLSRPGALEDEGSPEYAALQWLVKEDLENGMDVVEGTNRLEARYSLAVLWFSTEGENRWIHKLNFLTDEHECDWNDVVGVDDGNGGIVKATVGVICDENLNVVELAMIDQGLRGQLPIELSALSSLVSLSFRGNDLSGTIPDWNWKNLESLDLQYNELDGSIPTSLWTQYSSLKFLDLSHNKLSSTLPHAMSDLTSIESINLGYNQLSGTISLDPNEPTGEDDGANNAARTLHMPTLRTFNVTHNKMRGTLDYVELFPSLQVLDVTHNSMTGRIPGILGALTELQALYLSDNGFFGAIPTAIGSLTNLMTMVASNNAFNHRFPWDSFDANNSLTELIFSSNSLTGTLPTNMGTFSSLQVIDFGHNLMSGRIDPSIARDMNLRILRLSRNQFRGPLPGGNETFPETLEIIDLHSNQFSGELPASWASLSSLNVLTLHDNQFVGPIPEDWIQMSSLDRLTLHLNELKGSVDFMCDKQPQPKITANCGGAQPLVNCSCCSLCLE